MKKLTPTKNEVKKNKRNFFLSQNAKTLFPPSVCRPILHGVRVRQDRCIFRRVHRRTYGGWLQGQIWQLSTIRHGVAIFGGKTLGGRFPLSRHRPVLCVQNPIEINYFCNDKNNMKKALLWVFYGLPANVFPLYFVDSNCDRFASAYKREPMGREFTIIIWKSWFQSLFFPIFFPIDYFSRKRKHWYFF